MSRCLRLFADRRIYRVQAVAFASLALATSASVLADAAADAVIDKGIKAIGGEAKLAKARATTSKINVTLISGGNASDFKIEQTTDGLDRMRSTFEWDFGGNKATAVTVINGDKGWIKVFARAADTGRTGTEVTEIEEKELEDDKWSRFSQWMALMLVSLKGKDLKSVGDEKVGNKPVAGVKVTGPYDKDFIIYFDKESGLPVKVIADLPDREFMGLEFTMETYLSDYKDFGGIKLAKKVEMKRYGKTFSTMELVDFKVLNKVDDKTFAKPE